MILCQNAIWQIAPALRTPVLYSGVMNIFPVSYSSHPTAGNFWHHSLGKIKPVFLWFQQKYQSLVVQQSRACACTPGTRAAPRQAISSARLLAEGRGVHAHDCRHVGNLNHSSCPLRFHTRFNTSCITWNISLIQQKNLEKPLHRLDECFVDWISRGKLQLLFSWDSTAKI